MKGKVKFLVLSAGFVVLFAVAVFGYRYLSSAYDGREDGEIQSSEQAADQSESDKQQETEVVMAPDFSVVDGEGNTVRLSDFAGKPVVVNFWASWCGPCKAELPAFEAACKTYGEDVAFLMVNMTDGVEETVEGVQKFLEDEGYELPVYFDTEYSAAIAYGANSIPMTVFIYGDGSMLGIYRGAISQKSLNQYTEMVRDDILLQR